jgi:hypothetical protein
MSVPTTNYITYNPNTNSYQDLSGIFYPYIGAIGTQTQDTNFKTNTDDLNELFAVDTSGNNFYLNYPTNYIIKGTYTWYNSTNYDRPVACVTSSSSGQYLVVANKMGEI